MSSNQPSKTILENEILKRIYILRGMKIMFDFDLAEMYGVPTGRLNEAVKRNISRFPEDFMFQLSKEEFTSLISQFAISKKWGEGALGNCHLHLQSTE